MKIVFFEVEKWEEEYLADKFETEQITFTSEKLQDNLELAKDAQVISCFIYSTITKEVLQKLPNLKFITTRSTGFDHIDVASCQKQGIAVSNVPTYGVNTVAEHTFALILALSRKLVPSINRAKMGDFDLTGLRGFELKGKTIGIVGAGHIGKKVIELSLAFDMNVLVFTKTPQNEFNGKNVKYVGLPELLGSSDIVSLHLPENKETHHIINMGNVHQFKKGALLINTARGALIETQAILEGLEKGILAGVGIDVLEEECFLKEERELLSTDFLKTCDIKTQLLNHVLLRRDDVIITPHNAFNSTEALAQILDTTVDNIHGFLKNQPQNVCSS